VALAGNVTAAVYGGNLIVTGDNHGANITISQPRADQITLTGDGTTVNGSTHPTTFTGVTQGLRINLGNGNNSLTFDETNPITLRGNLSVNDGRGSNTISTLPGSPGSLNVGGNVSILNQPGPLEQITLTNLNVNGDVRIQNLGGDSLVKINVASAGNALPPSGNTIRGNLLIANGPGNVDQTDLSALNVKRNVQILNRGGEALTSIDRGSSSSTIGGELQIIDRNAQTAQTDVEGVKVGRDLQVAAWGPGNSTIIVQSSQVGGTTNLQGGNGGDGVVVGDSTFGGAFHLKTGKGDDSIAIGTLVPSTLYEVELEVVIENGVPVTKIVTVPETIMSGGNVTFNAPVTVNLGGGDDTLYLALGALVKFKKAATLNGQQGDTIANVDPANLPIMPTLKSFSLGTP
jgi:hypothetical protein